MKTLPYFFLILLFAIHLSTNAQTFRWATGAAGPGDEVVRHSTTDPAGNSYVLGNFSDSIAFGAGPGTVKLYSRGAQDIYLAKYSSTGALVWAKQAGGAGSDVSRRIHLDEYGMLYFCGSFTDSLWFDSAGAHSLRAGTVPHGFVVKFFPSGQVAWAREFEGTDVVINDVSSVLKECVITGNFYNSVDLDPGPGVVNHNSNGWRDALICKLDSAGNYLWSRTVGSDGTDGGDCIAVNGGQILIAGNFNDDIDLDPGPGVDMYNPTGTIGQSDVFLLHLWHQDADYNGGGSFGGPYPENAMDITPVSYPDFVLCGIFSEDCDFDPQAGKHMIDTDGGEDAFVMRVNHLEQLVWVRTVSGPANENARSVCWDGDGFVYLTGYFEETTDMDPGEYERLASSNGRTDMYALVLTDYGLMQCYVTAGGSGSEGGAGIGVDSMKNMYVHGFFGGNDSASVDFDPGPGASILHSPDDSYDAFMASYTTCSDFTAVNEHPGIARLSLFPNPANGAVELPDAQLPATVKVYDNLGKLVRSMPLQAGTRINVTGLDSGIYLVRCEGGGSVQTGKLIVQ